MSSLLTHDSINFNCTSCFSGLSEEDEKLITENVNVMIHSAATIRFDDHIKYVTNFT